MDEVDAITRPLETGRAGGRSPDALLTTNAVAAQVGFLLGVVA